MSLIINPDAKVISPPVRTPAAALNDTAGTHPSEREKAPEGTVAESQEPGVVSASAGEAEAGAPVDAARVANLREAVANDTYKVDALNVADRLIEMERQLG